MYLVQNSVITNNHVLPSQGFQQLVTWEVPGDSLSWQSHSNDFGVMWCDNEGWCHYLTPAWLGAGRVKLFMCGSHMTDPGIESHQCCSSVCGLKWSCSHAGCQEVSRCHIRGESEDSASSRQQSMQSRRSTLALKLRADIARSLK